jgi:hypothetical protein
MWGPVAEREIASLDDKYFFVSLSMILIGFIAVFEWDALFPDRKDYLLLTPLPIDTGIIFLAKVSALAAFLLAFTITIDLGPTILYPLEVLARRVTLGRCVQYVLSHGITMLLANVFVFFAAISIQGALSVLAPGRISLLISKYLRFLFFLAMIGGLFSIPGAPSVHDLVQRHDPLVSVYPPFWFVGCYEVLLGADIAIWGPLAFRAIAAIAIAGIFSILVYSVSFRRFIRRSVDLGPGTGSSHHWVRTLPNFVLDRLYLRNARDRALFHFAGQTIFRSSRHALRSGVYLALGIAAAAIGLITIAFTDDYSIVRHIDTAFLSVPMVLSFFLLSGTKSGFAIPVDLDANWIFRLAPHQRAGQGSAGIRKFLVCGILVPVLACMALLYRFLWDWPVILAHLVFSAVLSLLLIEILLSRYAKIPYACSYIPPPSSRVFKWPLFYIGFGFFAYVTAGFEGWLMQDMHRLGYFTGFICVVLIVWMNRHAATADKKALRFEEEPSNAPIYLDLQS